MYSFVSAPEQDELALNNNAQAPQDDEFHLGFL